MSTSRVIKDPNHPDFPHGTIVGGRRKCPCSPCRVAKNREDKRLAVLRERRGTSSRCAPAEVAERVVAHIKHLAEMPGFGYAAISESVGLSHSTAGAVVASGRVSPRAARALLSATPAGVAKHSPWVPHSEVMFLLRTMQALGYPVAWQERKIGHVGLLRLIVDREGKQERVDAKVGQKLRDLAREVGDRRATPGPDLPASSIAYALSMAKRHGYYPPAFYDEDGTLNWRSIPDHPWSVADEKAHRRIDLLRYVVRRDGFDMNNAEIALATGETKREVERVVAQFKLGHTERRRPKRIAWLKAQLDAFDGDADYDPITFTLDVGLYTPDAPLIPTDHPGFLSWREEHPDWLTARERKSAAQRERRVAARDTPVDLSTDSSVHAAANDAEQVAA